MHVWYHHELALHHRDADSQSTDPKELYAVTTKAITSAMKVIARAAAIWIIRSAWLGRPSRNAVGSGVAAALFECDDERGGGIAGVPGVVEPRLHGAPYEQRARAGGRCGDHVTGRCAQEEQRPENVDEPDIAPHGAHRPRRRGEYPDL